MKFELYGCDCETVGLDPQIHSPIEISIYRLSNDEQKTWCLKPLNFETIQADALRVNGVKIEDLRGQTAEGRERYQDPNKVLIEIENYLAEDGMRSEERLLLGHNANFDRNMLIELWKKCGSAGTFPFNSKYVLDTMTCELLINFAKGTEAEGYSLKNLVKLYGVVNTKAHSAAADTKATVDVFRRQIDMVKKAFSKSSAFAE